MSSHVLQFTAGFQFLIWIGLLWIIVRKQPTPVQNHSLTHSQIEDPVDPVNSLETVQKNKSIFDSWYEFIEERGEACHYIISTPQWTVNLEQFNLFQQFCSSFGLRLIDMDALDQLEEKPTLHLNNSYYLPFLWEQGYSIQIAKGITLKDLLAQASPFSLIIISVKDDGSQALNHKWQEELFDYGIRGITREHLRASYVNIIWKRTEHSFHNLYEEASHEKLAVKLRKNRNFNDFKVPINLEIISAGLDCGNESSIILDEIDYSRNQRGMNIVIYDLMEQKVVTQTVVDSFVTIYTEDTIYRAIPEVSMNESTN